MNPKVKARIDRIVERIRAALYEYAGAGRKAPWTELHNLIHETRLLVHRVGFAEELRKRERKTDGTVNERFLGCAPCPIHGDPCMGHAMSRSPHPPALRHRS